MCYDCIRELSHAAVAQSVVRRIGSAEVAGPIPASSLKALDFQGLLVFIQLASNINKLLRIYPAMPAILYTILQTNPASFA